MIKNKNLEELYEFYEDKMQSQIVTEEICDARTKIIEKTNYMNNKLTDEQKYLLQNLLELEHGRGALENKEIFIFAFSLAIKLIFSGLIKDDDDFESICKNV